MNTQKSCVLFKGSSQYDVLNFFLDAFIEAFKKSGYNCHVIDLSGAKDFSNYLRYLVERKNVSFIFSINGQMIYHEIDGIRHMLAKLIRPDIPFFTYMVDSPLYHYKTVAETAGIDVFSFVDKHAANLAREMSGKPSVFVPHGACLSRKTKSGAFVNKTVDLFFAGTYSDENSIYEAAKQKLDGLMFKLFKGVVEHMSSDYSIPVEHAVLYVCKRLDLSFDEKNKFFLFSQIASYAGADIIIRSRKRDMVLKAASDSNIKITICGSGWEKSPMYGNKNFIFLPALTFEDTLDMITEAKITLNVLPLFPNGSHERAFAAMANGSVLLSDKNIFFNDNFTHGEDILYYFLDKPDTLREAVDSVINNDALYQKIILNAQAKVMSKFSFDSAAKQILDAVNTVTCNRPLA